MTRAFRCLFLGVLALPLLVACGSDDAKKPSGKRAVPVTLTQAKQGTIARTLEAVGNVQPDATVAVKPQVGGQILEALVKSGQDVKKGQILFRLDPRPFEATVNEARAKVLRDQVLLKKAEEDKERFFRLVKQDAISREQYDQAVTNADSQRAVMVQDEAALASARLQLEYATIRAPMSGRVGEVLVDAGNVVKANDDRALLVINTLSPAKISFAVPERNLAAVREEMKRSAIVVEASPEGDTRPASKGTLVSFDNAVDKTTGTIKMEAQFPNTDLRLWPGQFTRIRVNLSEVQNAVLIPSLAVLEGVAGPYVYVVKSDKTVEVRLVAVARMPEGMVMVEKGLAPGETVVLDGQLNLAPGVLITPRTPEGAAAAPAPAGDGKAKP